MKDNIDRSEPLTPAQSPRRGKRLGHLMRKLRVDFVLILCGAVLLIWQVSTQRDVQRAVVQQLKPQSVFSVQMFSQFEPLGDEVDVYTYLPRENTYQQILDESLMADSMAVRVSEDFRGRQVHWSGTQNSRSAQYDFLVRTQGVAYQLPDDLFVDEAGSDDTQTELDEDLQPYLKSTKDIQVGHSEIVALWQSIAPEKNDIKSILSAIYRYTYENIETVPFKGTTDALTTLRLGTASCNGKSRLFVALARMNGIPARLVGGLILNDGSKKTSHQWVEVLVQDHWVPFGPTNGYFAEKPNHYLTLYYGDQVLFRHTSNIAFDYEFSIQKRLIASTFVPESISSQQNWNLASVLSSLEISQNTISILLMFPLCTLLITFLRNMIGIKTFGIFMPMLIAATCLYSGLLNGLLGFAVIVTIAAICHGILERMRVLKTARLAAVVTIVTLISLLGLSLADEKLRVEFGMLSMLPIVIISFISERVYQVISVQDWKQFWLTLGGTLLTIILCFSYMTSAMLQSAFSYYPALFLIILAAQLYIGQWSGLRLSELLRFKQVLSNAPNTLVGINQRNRELVYKLNDKKLLSLAADKLASKKALKKYDVPVAENLLECRESGDLELLSSVIQEHDSFVVKPNQGSQGNGIIVISHVRRHSTGPELSRQGCDQQLNNIKLDQPVCMGAGGHPWSMDALKRHIQEILAGTFSQTGLPDVAYIEPKIEQDSLLTNIAPGGLSDIRIVVINGIPVNAMLRMPTSQSSGKANLHQGAIGVAIDLKTGITTQARHQGKALTHHPDTQQSLINVTIPNWEFILDMTIRCYKAVPLGYLGVDICLDEKKGALVLEVNGRPGLEIQNVQGKGLMAIDSWSSIVNKIKSSPLNSKKDSEGWV